MSEPDGTRRSKLAHLTAEHAKHVLQAANPVQLIGGVQGLQDCLRDLGFFKASVDGIYGEKTQGALGQFQQAVGLPVTGVADQRTIDTLSAIDCRVLAGTNINEILNAVHSVIGHSIDPDRIPALRADGDNFVFAKLGDVMNGDKAEIIQIGLETLGFYKGAYDNIYGEQTATAVKRFQKAIGLPSTGEVDRKTLTALVAFEDVNVQAPTRAELNEVELKLGHRIEPSKIPVFQQLDQSARRILTTGPSAP